MIAAARDDIGRAELIDWQAQRLSRLLREILPANRFYTRKFREAGVDAAMLSLPDDLSRLPFTTKAELLEDQARHPPYGEILTYPLERYSRLHQTSGTSGRPLRWLDTPESWSRLLDCWALMFRMVGVTAADRLFFPFSFGPFLGFWTAFEAASRLGCLCLPGGGLSSSARLRFLLDNKATVVLCTPTYALRLAEVAQSEAALAQAQLNLQDATLLSPSAGTVLTRAVEPGTMLGAGGTVFTLSLTRPVWVRAYVNETSLNQAVPGTELEIYTDGRPGKPYHGKIGFVSPTAEFTPKSVETPDLRTDLVYRLRVIVTDADDALRQGMPVTLRFAKP